MTNEQSDLSGGHIPLTPPPASGPDSHGTAAPGFAGPGAAASAPENAPTPSSGRSPAGSAILTITAVIGGFALLGAGGTAAFAATGDLRTADRKDSVQSVDAEGVDSLDLQVNASSTRIEFGDVDEAELAVTSGRGPAWTLERSGDELVVRSPESRWGWWFGSWFGDEEIAVLTLPEELKDAALDADLTLNSGSLDVVGDFGGLRVDVSAGALDIEGAATGFDVDMSAGRADVLLDDVEEVSLGVSAGTLAVELTGTPPTQTTVDVSAGSLDLTVPDAGYTIMQDVSAGSLDATVTQSSSGGRVIDVTLSAGSVNIRPGD
ncbi:hypothetical protein AB3M89_04545 [Microbacterium sp. 179-I 3D2 NHS]|uniref:hypothetical protein n=1 Tax=Microbacterium sp. 179-I 3D2 NHS TaxID=3235178 RepID=UPI0039A33248